MAVLAQAAPGTDALAVAVVLAIFYMLIVRFMDLNEKEPLWAMGLVFGIGFFAAMLLYLLVGTPLLELQLVGGAVIRELVKILAVALAIGTLEAIGRGRGWSEVDGPLDGVVYGMAVGFGFATGAEFIRQLFVAASGMDALDILGQSQASQLWPIALRGLSEGLFGAVIGAGYGLAALPGKRDKRTVLLVGSGIAAIVLHVAYNLLTRGAATTR
jgi:RsiW-degrading membrane proteinase PrsW (M82 family)